MTGDQQKKRERRLDGKKRKRLLNKSSGEGDPGEVAFRIKSTSCTHEKVETGGESVWCSPYPPPTVQRKRGERGRGRERKREIAHLHVRIVARQGGEDVVLGIKLEPQEGIGGRKEAERLCMGRKKGRKEGEEEHDG